MLLSIIIPIFKVEEYVGTCLESIYSSEIDESIFEVIAVNDGTPDRSMEIVERYKSRHCNLKIVNQSNAGVSAARNNGIMHADGKFVTFVDPDDFLTAGALKSLCSRLVNIDSELIVMRSMKESKEVFPWSSIFKDGNKTDGINMYLQGYSRGSVWGCVYKKDFLIKYAILFPVGIRNGEDSIFFGLCQIWAKEAIFWDLLFYNVFVRTGSATTSLSKEVIRLYGDTANVLYNVIRQNESSYSKLQLSILSNKLYCCISQWVYSAIKVKEVDAQFLIKDLDVKKYSPIIKKYTYGFTLSKKIGLALMDKAFLLYYGIIKIKSSIL